LSPRSPASRWRVFAGALALGVLIAAGITLQRRGDTPAMEPDTSSPQPARNPGPHPQAAAKPRSVDTGKSVNSGAAERCAEIFQSATELSIRERKAAYPLEGRDADEFAPSYADLEALQRNLLASAQPEYVLAGHLLIRPESPASVTAPPDKSPWRELTRHAIASRSPLLAWHALRECVTSQQPCLSESQEQSLLDIDRQNSESWALVAILRHRRGDESGALTAMQGAASSPTSTYYWTETLGLIEQALASHSPMSYRDRVLSVFGVGAAMAIPPLANISRICRKGAATTRDWGEACYTLGVLQGMKNETEIARMFSYNLREQTLQAMGDVDGAAAVLEERAKATFDMGSSDLKTSMWTMQSALIESDPARFQAYLAAVRRFGEEAGVRAFLHQQIPLLLERAGIPAQEETRSCLTDLLVPPEA